MWEKIKNILSKEGGKCIIVEDNQPTYVVMKLEDYEKISQGDSSETAEVNRNLDTWKAEEDVQSEQSEPEVGQATEDKEEVKVEDLPF